MRPPRPKASALRAQVPRASSFWFGRTRPRTGGSPVQRSRTPPLLLRDAPSPAPGRPSPPLRDAPFRGTPLFSPSLRGPLNDSGRPHPKRPLPTSRRPSRRSPFSRFGGGSPSPLRDSPLAVVFQLRRLISRRQPPTWESHLSTPALNLEGTSRIVRKTGQKTRLFVQSGDSGRFPRPSRHVPQFRHCISPVHHCIYSGYI